MLPSGVLMQHPLREPHTRGVSIYLNHATVVLSKGNPRQFALILQKGIITLRTLRSDDRAAWVRHLQG